MATSTISVKYRPVRIGFIVRNREVEDLTKAAGINTLLWGGIYNPIIPVSHDTYSAKELIEGFSVDILCTMARTDEIDRLVSEYPYLKDPSHLSDKIFYQDWHTKKNSVGFLDLITLIEYYWNKEFRHKPKSYKSDCVLPEWKADDTLSNFFSICFGYFPDSYSLKDDFKIAFEKGLRARKVKIRKGEPIDQKMARALYPLLVTGLELRDYGYGRQSEELGIYVGDPQNFDDLLMFWNLRAEGIQLEFLPTRETQRFESFMEACLARLDKLESRHPVFRDHISVHYKDNNLEEIKEVVGKYKTKKQLGYWKHHEGVHGSSSHFYFKPNQALGHIDHSYDRYSLSVPLPEKEFLKGSRRNIMMQHLVVSIDPITEFNYPEHTLKPPFIPELNEFFSRKIVFDPWKLRVEKDGIGLIERVGSESVSLYPLPNRELVLRIFDFAGIKAETSQAGILAQNIINIVGDVDGGRVFKIKGVRLLLQGLKSEQSITTRSHAIKLIRNSGDFQKHERLFIEPRESQKLTPDDTFDFLLKNEFLRAGLELICKNCHLKTWLSLGEIDDKWVCKYCGHRDQTSLHLRHRGDWKFRKSGLFAKDNNQEGAIPVILTLLQFYRIFHETNFLYTTSLNLRMSAKSCETDFSVIQYHFRRDEMEIGIGECKSEGGRIDENDIEKLKSVQQRFKKVGISCYLVFSKTADAFEEEEIDLFKNLAKEHIYPVLFTNKELEPYEPYEQYREENLPAQHAFTFDEMARNSNYIYLKNT